MDPRFTGYPWTPDEDKTDLAPPESLNIPLWRSLLLGFSDRKSQEDSAPLQLTSHPVDLGMLPGDQMEVPWYRTVFTNIGDVVSPEILPPLQLESQPVDVGELIGDQLRHGWWSSLLRSLADKFAPEEVSPLHLTSVPVAPQSASAQLQAPRWSALIEAPQHAFSISNPEPGRRERNADPWGLSVSAVNVPMPYPGPFANPPVILAAGASSMDELINKGRTALRMAYAREAAWIVVGAAEVAFLLYWLILRR